jgi:hypothetical protein
MRHFVGWVCFWLASFWLWMLLVGEWNEIELLAAVIAATVTATFAEYVRSIGLLPVRVPVRRLGSLASALAMVPVDFTLLMGMLLRGIARGRMPRGRFVVREWTEATGEDPESRGIRAWSAFAANFSPNAYVVDIDTERQAVLLHDLVPLRQSEKPAG